MAMSSACARGRNPAAQADPRSSDAAATPGVYRSIMATRRRGKPKATPDDPADFDAVGTATQLGAFEAGGGVQHGLIAVVIAFILAIVLYPLARLRSRRRSGD
jgi:hypothetical protein